MAKSAAVRSDPYRNFRFQVEIDGIVAAGFSEVQIGETVTEVIDYREGNEPAHVRKVAGLHNFGIVTLTRGMMASMGSWSTGTDKCRPVTRQMHAGMYSSSSWTRVAPLKRALQQRSLAGKVRGGRRMLGCRQALQFHGRDQGQIIHRGGFGDPG